MSKVVASSAGEHLTTRVVMPATLALLVVVVTVDRCGLNNHRLQY